MINDKIYFFILFNMIIHNIYIYDLIYFTFKIYLINKLELIKKILNIFRLKF